MIDPQIDAAEIPQTIRPARQKGDIVNEAIRTRINLRPMTSVRDDVPTLAWEPKPGYPGIAVGTLVIFGGRPAAGKSTAARWLAAEATNGVLPGAWYGTPVGAAWIGTEESEVYMMKPGLRAAGADLDKVVIPEVEIRHNEVDDSTVVPILHCLDMDGLAAEFKAVGIKVVVLDPLMSAVGARTDVNRSNEVRARLEPWVQLAEAIDGVVIGIAHLKKSFTGDVVAALNGSSAFGEVARSIFGFAKDDNADDGTRLMSHAKSSIGPETLSYTYLLEPVEVTTDSGKTATVSRFVLGEETDRTVSDALRESASGASPTSAEDKPLSDKAAMLVQILTGANGALLELTKDEAVAQMGEAGYSADQTRRAREELAKRCRIGKPFRRGNSGPYYWKLLPFAPPDSDQNGARTTGDLPSCHPASDLRISGANQYLDGKDGRLANTPREDSVNRPATVTELDSRRSLIEREKVPCRVWFEEYLSRALTKGDQRLDPVAVIAYGARAGYSEANVRSVASAHPGISAIWVDGTTAWSLIGETQPSAPEVIDAYLDQLAADVTVIDQADFYAFTAERGITQHTARKVLVRSGRVDSVPAHGNAKAERIWRIRQTDDEVTA